MTYLGVKSNPKMWLAAADVMFIKLPYLESDGRAVVNTELILRLKGVNLKINLSERSISISVSWHKNRKSALIFIFNCGDHELTRYK